jgi:hypothetical protein
MRGKEKIKEGSDANVTRRPKKPTPKTIREILCTTTKERWS